MEMKIIAAWGSKDSDLSKSEMTIYAMKFQRH
jgi:hypothetical protein